MNRVLRRLTSLTTAVVILCFGLGSLSGQSANALAPQHEGAARFTGTTESKHTRFGGDDSANNLDSARVEAEQYREPQGYDVGLLLRVALTAVATNTVPSAQAEAEAFAAELRASGQNPRAASVAVDRTTGQVYRGTSGEATVRPSAIESKLPGTSAEPWSTANCAEVAACSSAVANGSKLKNLDVYTVKVKTPNVEFPPCNNCTQWVPPRKGG